MNLGKDLNENKLLESYPEVLDILLYDNTTKKNIIWGTNNYKSHGIGYFENDHILVGQITGRHGSIIKPRVEKSKKEQQKRSKDMAEVFTPSWICNKQNNLVDEKWFGYENPFNIEQEKTWMPTPKVVFSSEKTWKDYVNDVRLEITCGEAPYLVSRYDSVTGEFLSIEKRIGLLDRKLRVINENANNEEWYDFVILAFKSIYGFDYQGDNVLLARENLLFTFMDYYQNKFNEFPNREKLIEIAKIISWNIWQMDGLKMVVPNSCKTLKTVQYNLFGEEIVTGEECIGCQKNDVDKHNGIYCEIMDWDKNKKVKFVKLFKGGAR